MQPYNPSYTLNQVDANLSDTESHFNQHKLALIRIRIRIDVAMLQIRCCYDLNSIRFKKRLPNKILTFESNLHL